MVLSLNARPAVAATPQVTSHQTNTTSVGRYNKFEVTFQINKTTWSNPFLPYYYYDPADNPSQANYAGRTSPYGVDGITIDGYFQSPSGKTQVVPAFYYQEYTRTGSPGGQIGLSAGTNYSWKVRFAPEELGNYQYYLKITDKEGSTRYPQTGTLTFNATNSNSKGFVRVSPHDSRFLSYSNGDSFIPISSGYQWWKCCGMRSLDYESVLNNFGKYGVNLVRIWDQNDGYNLTVEGRFDGYKWPDDTNPIDRNVDIGSLPKGTQMNQRGNYEEDKILEAAERNGVLVQVCAHGDPYWIWDASIYSESWNTNPVAFDNQYHLNYWKRNFRYRVARWGYSTSVLAWEAWNEHGHIRSTDKAYQFYQLYGAYQLATDPYRHLRTTSQGSQAFSPGLWSSGAFDLANYHDYMMPGRYSGDLLNDEAYFVYRFAWCLREHGTYCSGLGLGDSSTWSGSHKPWVWGEFDIGTSVWNEPNPKTVSGDGRIRFIHNSTWAGLFSPIGTSPLDWYYDKEDAQTTSQKYQLKQIASKFFASVPYAQSKFQYLASSNENLPGFSGETIQSSSPQVRALGMRSQDKQRAYIWVQNRQYTWSQSPNTPSSQTADISINNLLSQPYRVEIWDTTTGSTTAQANQVPVSGKITVRLTGITKAKAIKIESEATSNPTPNPGSCTEDLTGDRRVDVQDLLVLLGQWSTRTNPVNFLIQLLGKFGQLC